MGPVRITIVKKVKTTIVDVNWSIAAAMQYRKNSVQLAVRLVTLAAVCVDCEQISHCRWPMWVL